MKNYALVALLVSLTACAGGRDGDHYDYGSEGARLYTEMCAVCHGEVGEGGLGPVLQDTGMSHDALTKAIDRRMPTSDPSRCEGDCAAAVADFVKAGLDSKALQCDEITPDKRRLRLLTRREYQATVDDLFVGGTVVSCSKATECSFYQSCDSGLCVAPSCGKHTFVYDAKGASPGSVHVAGSFNDWADSVAGGGYELTRDPGSGLWLGTFEVGEGTHSYKYVVDGNWIVDVRSPKKMPDGFGSENSVLELSCGKREGGALNVANSFPVESRPQGYDYDNNADAQVVTTRHLEAYLEAAETLAQRAAGDLEELIGCADGEGCAQTLVESFGTRVFRRHLSSDEKKRYLTLVEDAGSFAEGAELAIRALLVSPHFLYRSELGVDSGGGHYQLTDYEVASALSYTFLGTMPDQVLFDAAANGELRTPAQIEEQARRLLSDPRSRDMVGLFALQWLGAEDIDSVTKNTGIYGMFTEDIRAAMLRETREFAAHVVFDSTGSFGELVTADYTLAGAGLASYYGLPGTNAADGRVAYAGNRAGVLGHGSILAATAHSDQTSPIRRGLFVRQQLLCQDLPPPPPNAGGVPEVDSGATTRERFAQHTDNPFCAGCHQYIDGIGFGFERFDPIGRYRDSDNGIAIDPKGAIVGLEGLGSTTSLEFDSIPELANAIGASQAASSCFVRQYTRFVRGARETLENRCSRLALEENFARVGYDVRELMVSVVSSQDFRVRK